jgi:hypothetical protein
MTRIPGRLLAWALLTLAAVTARALLHGWDP